MGALPPGDGAVGVATAGRWVARRDRGPASALHERPWPDDIPGPMVWLRDATGPAVVLGSTQSPAVVDADRARAAGVEVARRRSGGGAVLVCPDEVVWADVLIPAGDPLWVADVSEAFHWIGRAWVEALDELGVDASWHDGPTRATPWSRLVCFAGVGPGEVTVPLPRAGTPAAKVVGISQRRARTGCLFQCAALLSWDPSGLLDVLRLGDDERRRAGDELRAAAVGLELDGSRLEQAFLQRLASR